MATKKILVTGAAGFIGSHMVEQLLKEGETVVGFDVPNLKDAKNLKDVARHSRFTYVKGDIRKITSIARAFTKDIGTVYHLASVVGIAKYIEDPFLLVDVSVLGTRNVAELALKRGAKIVFSSTSEIYGRNPNVPWAEDDDRVLGSSSVDRWVYSTAKACCEHMLFGLHRKRALPLTMVRYFNIYGPRQNPIFVVSQSVHKVMRGERPLLYDGGVATRCFTYVEDAIRGTIAAATHKNGNGQIFNIGNNKEVTIKEIVQLVINCSGKKIHAEALDTRKHYGKTYEDIGRRVPDVSKAKKLLGWSVSIPHDEGIRRTVEWASKNEWWWK